MFGYEKFENRYLTLVKILKRDFIQGHIILLDEFPNKRFRVLLDNKVLYNPSIVHFQNVYLVSA